jgi:hypothetical protein
VAGYGTGVGEVDAAVERVTVALRAYARAVQETPELAVEVIGASNGVLAAGIALQEAIGEACGWYVQLFIAEEGDDAEAESDDGRVLPGQGVAVRVRADFIVTDPERLLAAGRAAYRELWPEDPQRTAEQRVDGVEAAICELLHAHPAEPLTGMNLAEIGLAEAGTATAINRVDQVLDNTDGFPGPSEDLFTIT